MELRPSVGLPAPLEAPRSTSATGTAGEVVRLVLIGIKSMSFTMTTAPKLRWPESPSTIGTIEWLEMLSLSTWPWSLDRQSCTQGLESPHRALAPPRLCHQLISGSIVSRAAGCPPSMDMGTDLVCAPSWNHSTGPWVRAPQTTMTSGLPPNASAAHWEAGFTLEARESGHWSNLSRCHG